MDSSATVPGSGVGRFLVRTVRKNHVVRTHLNSCFERRHATYLPQISAETLESGWFSTARRLKQFIYGDYNLDKTR